MTLEELVVKITADTDGLDSGANKAKKILGNLGKVAIAGVAAVSGAAAAVAGKAIDSYADYEQLAGGVETLFKDSSDAVMKYAENAYKTAGLSANQYMETVTSFSASLLQSLGGDTEEAANKANLAITDMADNANKMGTSMESIQNAYQGFAKQNYTMLDNLKLGYGGTKQEMERLLSDAEALSGIHYDISSYADVVDAIHVIQTEIGITGTTALEASETISGSISTMKASWQNMLTGIADENADFGALTDNLVDSIKNVVKNLAPRIKTVVSGLGELVTSLLPPLLEMAIQFINDSLPDLITVATGALTTIAQTLVENLPMLAEVALQAVLTLATGIGDSLPELIPAAVDCIITIALGLLENIDKIIEAAGKLIVGLAEGLIKAIPQILKALPKIIIAIINGLLTAVNEMDNVGNQLIQGLFNGIKDATQWLYDKIKGWVGNVLSFIKNLFGIHSPSTVFAGFGDFMVQGLGKGIRDNEGKALSAVKDLAFAVEDAFNPKLEMENSFDYRGGRFATITNQAYSWIDEFIDKLMLRSPETPVVFTVDGKTFAQTSIKTINELTRQTGKLNLQLV